ncbi:hypothetical protein JDV02_006796 [Purpureocillium takamizusanense]|uniref:BRCT domain-containing protein n=1 Tax=Purpureocillium takamizusanense TaxID=2060973 RepID=A0A9Q8QKZ3_9HYPO|nr:uncharacterized protein JDV02_006796 [Purpureocillium takamizusanense]UNI20731.1 hypothetical protein JDV02_006796 [Purpureocillium takamizusanense]
MPAPPHPALPGAAEPVHAARFDPWNSSSTGHQRGDRRPGTSWRDARTRKVNSQFRSGGGGDDDASDGGQSSPSPLGQGRRSVADMLARPGLMRRAMEQSGGGRLATGRDGMSTTTGTGTTMGPSATAGDSRHQQQHQPAMTTKASTTDEQAGTGTHVARENNTGSGILAGVVAYVNGSTYPLVSDHRLRQLLAEHGAAMSLHLGRRRVTHVILGRPSSAGRGAGGGLAGGKLEREIRRVAGCGVKFVGVEWILESIKAGKRLPEARFATLKIAPQAQGSVYGLFSGRDAAASRNGV